ncbi:hypothetical protein [Thermococcus sp. AM4]|uniref:hypothetical protein n=1 Tax=Thermococcus sp. (strain AM4) TaxID=246969 RepID=UPI00018711EB|nr:hypothetical protein [Thermococcus sp. AM4]EEB73068.1 conserved hypothetical protein [Thermococcus sp. AM4]
MALIFTVPEEREKIIPFEGFPLGIERGSSIAMLFSDELSEVFLLAYLEAALLEGGKVYHVQVGGGFSPLVIRRIVSDTGNFHFGKTYRLQDVIGAMDFVEPGSALVVSGFPLLDGKNGSAVVKVLEKASERDLTLVLTHTPLVLNELDLFGEFRRYFEFPELFEYLMVARVTSYRGHYRLGISLLRAPGELVGLLGEHSVPIDKEIAPLLNAL